MDRATRLSGIIAAVVLSGLAAACAELDQSAAVGGTTATLICDNGRSFTVAYQDGFDTAIIETADGRRAELTRVRTTIGLNPTPPLPSSLSTGDTAFQDQAVQFSPQTGATGVRYSDGNNLLLSRDRFATLQLDGETFSNCETPR
jgi:membrane-bound inhibitor of C-type lysozyme